LEGNFCMSLDGDFHKLEITPNLEFCRNLEYEFQRRLLIARSKI
jgi:hypothetical protein